MLKIIKNPDKTMSDTLIMALKENHGYCPCQIEQNEDTKCICKDFREQNTVGECHCGLYIKVNPVNFISGYADGGITDGQTAVVGEIGRELVILPNGKTVLLGRDEAELYDLPTATQIINNKEKENENMNMNVKIVRLNKDLPIPKYQTLESAGLDLHANIDSNVILKHKEIKVIPTGIKVQLPTNYEMQIRPRSGLAAKHGITVLNAPGTVDADFRGEIKVILINHSYKDFTIHKGDRIAQAVINQICQASLIEVEELNETNRSDNGFGSTGEN